MPRDADPVANVCEGGDHQRRNNNRSDAGRELSAPLAMNLSRREPSSDEPLKRERALSSERPFILQIFDSVAIPLQTAE